MPPVATYGTGGAKIVPECEVGFSLVVRGTYILGTLPLGAGYNLVYVTRRFCFGDNRMYVTARSSIVYRCC